MRLSQLLGMLAQATKKLKDLDTNLNQAEWSRAKLRLSHENQIQNIEKQITQFGSGHPVFRIVFASNKKAWKVYYQAETKDEAIAACILHHQENPIEIIYVNTIELKVIKTFIQGYIK